MRVILFFQWMTFLLLAASVIGNPIYNLFTSGINPNSNDTTSTYSNRQSTTSNQYNNVFGDPIGFLMNIFFRLMQPFFGSPSSKAQKDDDEFYERERRILEPPDIRQMNSYHIWDPVDNVDLNMLSHYQDIGYQVPGHLGNEFMEQQIADIQFPSEAPKNNLLIVPGTKWCGPGSNAVNINDLGEYRSSDMCCREHDLCPDSIPGNQCKHGICNPMFHTRSHCNCDEKFHNCLLRSNTSVSFMVGKLYFNVGNVKCYRLDYPIIGCKTYVGIIRKICVEYIYDVTRPKLWQFFDNQPFPGAGSAIR